MSLWERVMLHFFPRHHPDAPEASKQVDAAFERMVCARIQVGEVAGEVAQTARAHHERVQVERQKIRQRTAETAAKYPTGRTSEIRNLVEDMLESLDGPKDNEGRRS
ncbi:hypothetical protein [Methylobacterium sp. WL8]|uniref:hypothetical protein n=1 Tax=Methylobacterium sp. WL8 TaxID=2603899 RepID=UPI0011CBCC5E|nr:hypothetical protein [Methylobacterium sp. WL8]TXN78280.1 hypothetical protein FV234_22970 [Methylobacterium sp. WL8]